MCALSQSRAARAGFVVCSDVHLAAPWARVLWPWKLEPARRAFTLELREKTVSGPSHHSRDDQT